MKPVVVVDADTLAKERRRTMYAYAASFLAQVIAFSLGWIMCANWPEIVKRLA